MVDDIKQLKIGDDIMAEIVADHEFIEDLHAWAGEILSTLQLMEKLEKHRTTAREKLHRQTQS